MEDHKYATKSKRKTNENTTIKDVGAQCYTINCKNRRNALTRRKGITFHKFPNKVTEKSRHLQWYRNLGRITKPGHWALVCSEHFNDRCFDRTGQNVRLKPDAVPTLCKLPRHLKKPQTARKTAVAASASAYEYDVCSLAEDVDVNPSSDASVAMASKVDGEVNLASRGDTVKRKLNRFKDASLWKVLTCSAGGCPNTSSNKHLLFHEFPTDASGRHLWLAKLKRVNEDGGLWTPSNTSQHYLCSAHFTESSYTRREDDGKKLLKPSAVPTIIPDTSGCSDTSVDTADCNAEEPECEHQKVSPSAPEPSLEKSARVLIPELQKECDKYKKLYEQEMKTTTRLMEILSKMFTEDQVTALLRGYTRGILWSDESISRAIQLKVACGNSGYEALINLGIPLPCFSTIKKRISGLESIE
ncbi:uncharacterized protein [Watersipora subatra]|uniref:uncharacterized protein n=1 Tax=Watersipora subatra TaxID=2589382 RepID=UPI00355C15AB